jgi:hypothetical protein
MFDANDPAFRQQYPNGATVYDRTGRRVSGVVAFNPATGEVIRHGTSRIVGAVLRLVRSHPQIWDLPAEFRRHGFWPAPLTIRANMPPLPRHPMCRCILMLPVPLKPATEADLAFTINEPLPEVAWRSLVAGESVTTEEFIDPCRPPLPVLDDRTPEEICGYGDDGLCSH